MADWIEWKGGDCPVDGWVRVAIRMRDGAEDVGAADGWDWSHIPHPDNPPHWGAGDIIAYRIVEGRTMSFNDGIEAAAGLHDRLSEWAYEAEEDPKTGLTNLLIVPKG